MSGAQKNISVATNLRHVHAGEYGGTHDLRGVGAVITPQSHELETMLSGAPLWEYHQCGARVI